MISEPTEAEARRALDIAVQAADAAGVHASHPYRILFENVGYRSVLLADESARLRAALQQIIDAPMIDHQNPENSAQAIARAALEAK